MPKVPLIAALMAFMALVPAFGAEENDNAMQLCTEANMMQLDQDIANITDAGEGQRPSNTRRSRSTWAAQILGVLDRYPRRRLGLSLTSTRA
jgi:hypothetical protein